MNLKEKLFSLLDSRWFMKIKDKVNCNHGAHCPPHYLPHKIPIGPKVSDEPCHFHVSELRMKHHTPFCKAVKCPYVDQMLKARENYINAVTKR